MGVPELVIILVIVLIIFGSSRLPGLGEGVGKALKGFKKAVHEEPPPLDPNAPAAPPPIEEAQVIPPGAPAPAAAAPAQAPGTPAPAQAAAQGVPPAAAPAGRTVLPAYQPGPEATPGTTAALMASAAPQAYQPKQTPPPAPAQARQPAQTQSYPNYQPPTMEERAAAPSPGTRAQYPPLPPSASQNKPGAKRPSAIVNKDAVARVQAQQAARKAKTANPAQAPAPSDMQGLGEGVGDALRTFRHAVNDVRSTVDPQMRTIQAEVDAAQKEIEQTIENAKEMPPAHEEPPPRT